MIGATVTLTQLRRRNNSTGRRGAAKSQQHVTVVQRA